MRVLEGDGPDAIRRLLKEGEVDIITADYLAEVNIAWRALELRQDPNLGYEKGFLSQLDRTSAVIVKEKGVKIIHNGGALNPAQLALEVQKLLESYEVDLKVAYVTGDNVMDILTQLAEPGVAPHLDNKGRDLSQLDKEVVSANAYVGMSGIVAALQGNADIVICGRCTDASPVMGAAAWWHGWGVEDYDYLARSLIAGHCIECGCYATGGNFSGFKSIPDNQNQGYPVAEIHADGGFELFLQHGARGLINCHTITAQLVYEIQGPSYLNPDVVANITDVQIQEIGKNRVAVTGITGGPPPPTTKLAVCAVGGYQCECSMHATGLDIPEKLEALRRQIYSNVPNIDDYIVLRVDQYGWSQPDPKSQALSTVQFRVFAQAKEQKTLSTVARAIMGYGLGGYCGMHLNMDFRTMAPKMFINYEPFIVDYSLLHIQTHFLGQRTSVKIEPPPRSEPFRGQSTLESETDFDPNSWGPSQTAPLGSIVHARSGDKGSNANVGLWVRDAQEYGWLKSLLSTSRFAEFLADDYDPSYMLIERFELPNLHAVHFLVKNILDGGISSTWKLDGLAKSFGEFVRARHVEVPVHFLSRGTI